MPDEYVNARISDLTAADSISDDDLFVLEQSATAKKLPGLILKNMATNAGSAAGAAAGQAFVQAAEAAADDAQDAAEAAAQSASDAHDEYLATVSAGTQAVSDIGTAKTNAISDITSAEAAAQAAIASEKTEALAEIDSAVEEVESYAYDIEGLKDLQNEKQVSGTLITLEDAAPLNAKKVLLTLKPKQDLHGQANPYPAGGGKNKLPLAVSTIKTLNTSGTWSGNTYTVDGVSFAVNTADENIMGVSLSGSASGNKWLDVIIDAFLEAGSYYLSGGVSSDKVVRVLLASDNTEVARSTTGSVSFTVADGTVGYRVQIGLLNSTAGGGTLIQPMIRLSTESDSTFAPYSNICPIEGYTGVKITRCGKNRLDPSTLGLYDVTGTEIMRYGFASILLKAGTYTLSKASGNTVIYITNVTVGYTVETVSEWPFTFTLATDSEVFIRSALTTSSGYNLVDVQLEEGSTATEYEAYKGQIIVENICINQWDGEYSETDTYLHSDGSLDTGAYKASFDVTSYILVDEGKSYYLAQLQGSTPAVCFYDSEKTYISGQIYNGQTSMVVTAPTGAKYLRASTFKENVSEFRVNYPASFTDYYPYTGNGVAYSGTIDLDTGKMVLDSQFYQYDGSENWALVSNNQYYSLNVYQPFARTTTSGISSHFIYGPINTTEPKIVAGVNASSGRYVLVGKAIMDTTLGISDVTGWKNWLASQYSAGTPLQVWYELKEPITIQLTPQQLELVKGFNFISTDADDMELVYCYVKDGKSVVVGNAEQLLSKEMVNDQEPYLFRASGGNGADREYDVLVGGTVNWGQMFKNGNFPSDSAYWQLTGCSGSVANNTLTVTVTNAGNANRIEQRNLVGLANHVYMVLAEMNPSKQTKVSIEVDSGNPFTGYIQIDPGINFFSPILKANTDFTIVRFYFNRQSPLVNGDTVAFKELQLFDLTAIFGTTIADYINSLEQATAGSGIVWLKKYGFFTKPYYPYNTGELMSVKTTRHKMVGFNLFDGECTGSRTIDPATGAVTSGNFAVANHYIKCEPNTQYWYGGSIKPFYYDDNKNFIGTVNGGFIPNRVLATPDNCYYILLLIRSVSHALDACLNLSKTTGTPKNGDYLPYATYEYPLDPKVTLQGIYKLNGDKLYCDGDRYYPDKGVERRYKLVDLGTLNWVYAGGYFRTADLNNVLKRPANNSTIPNVICVGYTAALWNNSWSDKIISIQPENESAYPQNVFINDTSYTDAATFKAAMNGVYMLYELATPYFEPADPFEQLQALDPYGTEEYIDDREVPIPVGHDTNYPVNLRAEIERVMKEVPPPPTSNGTYILKVTVVSGVPTYSWVAQ